MDIKDLYSLLGKIVLLRIDDNITVKEYCLLLAIIREKIDNIGHGNI